MTNTFYPRLLKLGADADQTTPQQPTFMDKAYSVINRGLQTPTGSEATRFLGMSTLPVLARGLPARLRIPASVILAGLGYTAPEAINSVSEAADSKFRIPVDHKVTPAEVLSAGAFSGIGSRVGKAVGGAILGRVGRFFGSVGGYGEGYDIGRDVGRGIAENPDKAAPIVDKAGDLAKEVGTVVTPWFKEKARTAAKVLMTPVGSASNAERQENPAPQVVVQPTQKIPEQAAPVEAQPKKPVAPVVVQPAQPPQAQTEEPASISGLKGAVGRMYNNRLNGESAYRGNFYGSTDSNTPW